MATVPSLRDLSIKWANQTVADQIFQDQFGRNATPAEAAQVTKTGSAELSQFHVYAIDNSNIFWPSAEAQGNWWFEASKDPSLIDRPPVADPFADDPQRVADVVDSYKHIVFNDRNFKKIAKNEINTQVDAKLKETFGITDQSKIDNMKEKFDSLRALDKSAEAGTGAKESIESIDRVVTTIKNDRDAAVELIYVGEYGKILEGDNKDLNTNLDEYLSSIEGSDVGLDILMEKDNSANRKLTDVLGSTINDAINADETVQKTLTEKSQTDTEDTPFGQKEVTQQLNEARNKLSDELAAAEGNRTEALRSAFKAFTDKIPEDIAKVRDIAEERLTERLKELPETFGEFGARLGLGVGQSGQLQQALAKETAFRTAETERRLQEFQLGREREAAGIGLNLEQQIADFQAQREGRIAELGFGIEQTGTQIGREDFQTQLAQQFQQAQIANQQEYNTFLTQMGYRQNQIAQQQQFQQQLGLLQQQQAFQSGQSELDRQLKERLFNRSAELAEQQRKQQRKQQKAAAIQSLAGTAIGALGGGFLGGIGVPGAFSGTGALIGGGLLGGNQTATAAGFSNLFNIY